MGKLHLIRGECVAAMRDLPPESFDSIVCDPPYHLTSIVKRFGAPGAAPSKSHGAYANKGAMRGFMGQTWDGGDVAFRPETWAAALRLLKPGGHLVAFSGTRTYHRMACAIEDAGFEMRDMLSWLYGSGFPKSLDVSKAIDKAQTGVVRGEAGRAGRAGNSFGQEYERNPKGAPITSDAIAWNGWGTALKPACEPVALARKPLSGTVAATVLAHGTGALNIDGCRVGSEGGCAGAGAGAGEAVRVFGSGLNGEFARPVPGMGRWPANVMHDGSPEVLAGFPESASGEPRAPTGSRTRRSGFAMTDGSGGKGDSGSAARFFYTAKADALDRRGSSHPTVKPIDLMRWLVRLVTPPGGRVLDPFGGTGTTLLAAHAEGMACTAIEMTPEFQADIARAIAHAEGRAEEAEAAYRAEIEALLDGADGDRRAMLELRLRTDFKGRALPEQAADAGPLFGGAA